MNRLTRFLAAAGLALLLAAAARAENPDGKGPGSRPCCKPCGECGRAGVGEGTATNYEFDHAYRLTRETRKDAAGQTLYDESFTFDPVGNRLTRNRTQNGQTENTVYAYNAANQLVTETTNGVTTAYGYDKNGNNTTISTPAANGNPAKNIAMAYDWLNRQTKWTDGERTESTVFAGADWKRASTTVMMGANAAAAPPSIVKYLYDGDNVLADFGNDDALTAFYVTPGLDQNLSITDASGATSYYTQDGLGSVRLLTSANGAILNRYDYTAFGETFAPNTVTTTSNRYTYTAREQSPLAAHGAPMHYRWRNYAPQIGRFMWRDPIGYDGGVNVYGYVENITGPFVDSYGMKAIVLDWETKPGIDTEPVFSQWVPESMEQRNKRIDTAIQKIQNISDEDWKELQITFNKKTWGKNKEELIAAIEREKGSVFWIQNRGDVSDTVTKLHDLGNELTEEYDELGFASHGYVNEIETVDEHGHTIPNATKSIPCIMAPKFSNLNDPLKSIPQSYILEKQIRNAGMQASNRFMIIVCNRQNKPRKNALSMTKGRFKVSKCSIEIESIRIVKYEDGQRVDDGSQYER